MRLAMRNVFTSGGGGGDIPYITDGLVAMWDGIWNAGVGVHDQNATTWKDLVTGINPSVTGSLSWGTDKAVFDGSTVLSFDSENIRSIVNSGNTTVECVCLRNVRKNYDGPFMFAGNRGILVNGSSFNTWDSVSYLGAYKNHQTRNGLNVLNRVILNASLKTLNYQVTEFSSKSILISGSFVRTSGSTSSSACKIGYGYDACMKGYIHAIRIYNRSISASELDVNYAVDVARFNLATA